MSVNTEHASQQRYSRVLACALCQQRKVKCDRQEPCSNCVKANAVCTPSIPATTRRRRRPNQDLRERLARCEMLLLQCTKSAEAQTPPAQLATGQIPLTPATTGAPEPERLAVRRHAMSDSSSQSSRPSGMMVQGQDGSRFMDSHIWADIYKELQDMRALVETDDGRDSEILGCDDSRCDSSPDLLCSGDDTRISMEDLQPEPVQVLRLWQLFLDRVNPLSKIIHVPTVQPYVMEAATKISNVPLQHQALLFSIYTMAVVSLSDHECEEWLNLSRDAALQTFTLGAKLSLIRFDFLKNYDMAILQALILFLWSLAGRYDRYRAWMLSGIVVRIAQKAGYHRDGELINLSPFETEMRRRIWWQIIVQDSTHAMASGLNSSLLPANWDTKEPQNLNDADLFPNSTEPARPRDGPTEMAFCLILHRVYRFMTEAAGYTGGLAALGEAILEQTSDRNSDAAKIQAAIATFRGAAVDLDTSLRDLEERFVDVKAGNAHVAALTIRPSLMQKIEGMIPNPEQTGFFSSEENAFQTLLVSLEHGCKAYEHMAACRFEWSMQLHFRLDIFAAFTGQLRHRPDGPLADRGWVVVEKVYAQHPELFDMTEQQCVLQARYVLEAWKIREAAMGQAGQTVQRPTLIAQLHASQVSSSQRPCQSFFSTPSVLAKASQRADTNQLGEAYGQLDFDWTMWDELLPDHSGQP